MTNTDAHPKNAKDYPIELSRWTEDDDSYWVAEIPDLPGCVTHGETPGEAVDGLDEAKRLWISTRLEGGHPVPEPTETRAYSGRVLVRMPRSLHRALVSQAKRERMSLNAYLISLLSRQSSSADGTRILQKIADLEDKIRAISAALPPLGQQSELQELSTGIDRS